MDTKKFEYRQVNLSDESDRLSLAEIANIYAELGWRIVSHVSILVTGHRGFFLLERVKNPYDPRGTVVEQAKWVEWQHVNGRPVRIEDDRG